MTATATATAAATAAPYHNKKVILDTSFSFRKQSTDQSNIDRILTLNGSTKKRDQARNSKLVELLFYLNILSIYFNYVLNYIQFVPLPITYTYIVSQIVRPLL